MQYVSTVTKATMLTNVRRARMLKRPGEIVVRVGQKVNPAQVVARSPEMSGFRVLRASQLLDVPADELGRYLLVEEGSMLQKGAPLMRKPVRFGRVRLYRSPVEGVLHLIRDGCLVIQQLQERVDLRAMIHGEVVNVMGGRGVMVRCTGSLIQALWDSGKEAFGKIKMAVASPEGEAAIAQIGSEIRGSILVAGRVRDWEMLKRLEVEGARGLIVGSMPARLCLEAPTLSFPVVITDGIGVRPMARPMFELLKQSEEREASLLASDEGSRGQRTEIIIPLPTTYADDRPVPDWDAIKAGRRVRVVRSGEGSGVAEVVRVCHRAQKTPVGTPMPGAEVQFENGEMIFVPFTNLDLLVQR